MRGCISLLSLLNTGARYCQVHATHTLPICYKSSRLLNAAWNYHSIRCHGKHIADDTPDAFDERRFDKFDERHGKKGNMKRGDHQENPYLPEIPEEELRESVLDHIGRVSEGRGIFKSHNTCILTHIPTGTKVTVYESKVPEVNRKIARIKMKEQLYHIRRGMENAKNIKENRKLVDHLTIKERVKLRVAERKLKEESE